MPKKRNTIEFKELVKLHQAITALKKTPKDFRDMEPHTPQWQKLKQVMGHKFAKRMNAWAYGEVIYVGKELSEKEKRGFSSQCTYIRYPKRKPNSLQDLLELFEWVEERGSSFVYLRLPVNAISGLNTLLSHYGHNFRIKGKLS